MTIKKPMRAAPTGAAVPATGGATIADRFKLDLTDPAAKKPAAAGKETVVAVIAGVLALATAGILTYVLWKHWEFLMPA